VQWLALTLSCQSHAWLDTADLIGTASLAQIRDLNACWQVTHASSLFWLVALGTADVAAEPPPELTCLARVLDGVVR
jgi:arginine exporter protein ArgO